MTATHCEHERDVLDLVAVGQWPQRADAALRGHVAACGACREVAAVADAVRLWGDEKLPTHLPDSSVVWHRAQRRARESAARTASRPVWAAQVAAVAVFVVALMWIGPGLDWYQSAWQATSAAIPTVPAVSAPDVTLPTWSPAEGWARVAWMAAGALAVAVSVIVGALKLADDR